eukprot:jgi/Chrzof1/572/Cz01g20255.t1
MKHACLITCAVLLVTSVHLSFAQSSSKVPVEFYAEALCPYCANFTITHLSQLFRNGLSNVVELDYIPFGNARYDQSTGNITCQHGRQECELNKVIGCALEAYPQQDEWFRFLECVEAQVLKDAAFPVERTTSLCAVKAGIRPDKVLDCYKGRLGDDLQRRAWEQTESLKPPHLFVPWVVVNGIPLAYDYENVQKYICAAYYGFDRPDVCLEVGPAPDSCDVKQLVSPRAPVGKANLAGHWSAGAVQPLPREGHV